MKTTIRSGARTSLSARLLAKCFARTQVRSADIPVRANEKHTLRADRDVRAPSQSRCFTLFHAALALLTALILLPATGCKLIPAKPIPPANLSEPGWTTRQGDILWKPDSTKPEIAGELMLANRPDGRVFTQVSKEPLTILVAQSEPRRGARPARWQVEDSINNKHHSGHGQPPTRLIFLYLPRMLAGKPPPKGWTWHKTENNGWRIENRARGESLEVYFNQ